MPSSISTSYSWGRPRRRLPQFWRAKRVENKYKYLFNYLHPVAPHKITTQPIIPIESRTFINFLFAYKRRNQTNYGKGGNL